MEILRNLNDKQREAVLETEGYVRVIAGAGSGKTKLLVSRYAHHMVRPNYRPLICGCVCAGRMEGNIDRAKAREAELKSKNKWLNGYSRNSNSSSKSSSKTMRKEENEYSYINGVIGEGFIRMAMEDESIL